LIHTVKT